ncbi:hypothetical protein HHI36_000276 [Cryptolaemus montrouzieri]|uniref:Uncharacterized protein n=1 Tax=Cryptolaemus montrouzieri TaxID=559131 RepID=A0ABD2P4I2_9CUCU
MCLCRFFISYTLTPEVLPFLSTAYNRESEAYKTSKGVCFLGTHDDYRLSWRDHIHKVARSMARYVYALRTLADTVSQGAAFMAYHAYVHSRLRYGIVLWENSSEKCKIYAGDNLQ